MLSRSIAFAALCGLATVGAQAFQGEQNPLPAQPFHSTLSRDSVRMDARQPFVIGNGGNGVESRVGLSERADVRAGALAVTANGASTYGDIPRESR